MSERDDWRENVKYDDKGKPLPRLVKNAFWYLVGHDEMRDVWWWNSMAHDAWLVGRPPWERGGGGWKPRGFVEADKLQVRMWLEEMDIKPARAEISELIKGVALMRRFNPVVDYLTGLVWDGVPRLQGGSWDGEAMDNLAVEYFGAPRNSIIGTFMTKWHVSAVARAFQPGCKADCMIVLEGAQGRLKSTYVKTMATIGGVSYFADNLGDIMNKESILMMKGRWLVENAELGGFIRQHLEHLKAWLSRSTDLMINKFESQPTEQPRSYVVAGTHNPSGRGYLKDATGARRFWPVPVRDIDVERVEQDRDQIWAEAVTLYRAGMQWWLTDEESLAADELTGERRAVHPWAYRIEDIVRTASTTSGVMSDADILAALNVPSAQHTETAAAIISEIMKSAGYERVKIQGQYKWKIRSALELVK